MLVTDYIFNASDWDIQLQWSMNEKRMSATKCNLEMEEVLKELRLIDSATYMLWESTSNKGVFHEANFEQFKIVKAPFGQYNLMVIFTSNFDEEPELFTRQKYNNKTAYEKSWWEMRKEWDDFFNSCIGPNKNLEKDEDDE